MCYANRAIFSAPFLFPLLRHKKKLRNFRASILFFVCAKKRKIHKRPDDDAKNRPSFFFFQLEVVEFSFFLEKLLRSLVRFWLTASSFILSLPIYVVVFDVIVPQVICWHPVMMVMMVEERQWKEAGLTLIETGISVFLSFCLLEN